VCPHAQPGCPTRGAPPAETPQGSATCLVTLSHRRFFLELTVFGVVCVCVCVCVCVYVRWQWPGSKDPSEVEEHHLWSRDGEF